MNEAEKANVYLEVAKMAQSAFFNRRDYEWKVSLGLWGVLIAAIGQDVMVPVPIALIAFLGYGFFWLRPIAAIHDDDKKLCKHYWNAAISTTKDPSFAAADHPGRMWWVKSLVFWLGQWGILFQLLVSGLLSWYASMR